MTWLLVMIVAQSLTWGDHIARGDRHFGRGEYREAAGEYREALREAEWQGPQDPRLMESLVRLGVACHKANEFAAAEMLYERALLLDDSPANLNNLATLYRDLGRPEQAETLLRRALQRSDEAVLWSNLALVLWDLGYPERVEPILRRVLARLPDLPMALNNLAALYRVTGRLGEAESLVREALRIWGDSHPERAAALNNLASILIAWKRWDKAEAAIERAMEAASNGGPELAAALNNRAVLEMGRKHWSEAARTLERAIAIDERALGEDNPRLAPFLANYGAALRKLHRSREAREVEGRARELLRRRHIGRPWAGPTHPLPLEPAPRPISGPALDPILLGRVGRTQSRSAAYWISFAFRRAWTAEGSFLQLLHALGLNPMRMLYSKG